MYYKLRNSILFRQYDEYGYITDNAMFGYYDRHDAMFFPGSQFVSESGAVMLGALSKAPQHIDDIMERLIDVFVDVDYEELKQDVLEFYNLFVETGFLSCGTTPDGCRDCCDLRSYNQIADDVSAELTMNDDNYLESLSAQGAFLRSLHIEIANECNERCIHCYIPHEYKINMMNSELFFRIIEEGRKLNIINVTISGGEPLLHKDFICFLSKCLELDLSVNILSNLTLLTDEMIDEMRKNPLLSVQTSLYSMDAEIHDSITKVKGSFEKTMNGILKLKEIGIPLQISCPIIKRNLGSFHDVVLWGAENKISVTVNYEIFASYDHTNDNLVNRLSLEEAGQVFDIRASDSYVKELHNQAEQKCKLTEQAPICSICRNYFCVSPEGFAFPCVGWKNKVVGDLNQQTLQEVWESSPEICKLREIKRKDFPKCIDCKDRGYCTVCMMSNSNANSNGDAFAIQAHHCKAAALIHEKVNSYLRLDE